MDLAEFVSLGYLHEVNRRFFHPLGLALETSFNDRCERCKGSGIEPLRVSGDCEACGGSGKRPESEVTYEITGVWDCRDDPEGIRMAIEILDLDHAKNIDRIWAEREPERKKRLGYMVQPPDPQSLTAGALLDA